MKPSHTIITPDGYVILYTALKFSGGEIQVRFDGAVSKDVIIDATLDSSDALMELFLLTDAIRRRPVPPRAIHLRAPYLPYARQDRVCSPGEALSLRVICDLINAQNYASVEVWDVHSNVALALLDNVRNVPAYAFLRNLKSMEHPPILVAPDKGAVERVLDVSKTTGATMVRADKVRNTATGEITDTVVYSGLVGDADFLIVDDICDGGRTFIELARKLRPLTAGKVMLYVTHGIFAKGVAVFDGLIDHIYCANIFPGVPESPILTKIWRAS
jgi:ribose-phosphate pyrophosphokinase